MLPPTSSKEIALDPRFGTRHCLLGLDGRVVSSLAHGFSRLLAVIRQRVLRSGPGADPCSIPGIRNRATAYKILGLSLSYLHHHLIIRMVHKHRKSQSRDTCHMLNLSCNENQLQRCSTL